MTGKQIMIDGVDVSKCIFFNKNYKEDDVQIKNFCELQYISCKEFDCANCYFKKWKRKEQECEGLKEEVSLLKESNSKLQQIEDVNSLEKCYLQQLDQLKAKLEQEKALKETYFACYKAKHDDIDGELLKLKQTLAEIKEIAEHCYDPVDKENDGFWSILQKISECEVKNERNRKDV